MLRCVPHQTGMLAGQVHRQRGVAGPQETSVGHELGAADHCHACGRRRDSGPALRRSSCSRLYQPTARKVFDGPKSTDSCLIRLSQSAIRLGVERRSAPPLRIPGASAARACEVGSTSSRSPGRVGQPFQQRLGGDALGLARTTAAFRGVLRSPPRRRCWRRRR